jgi:transcriptional regulator with XRE-family HTH domain
MVFWCKMSGAAHIVDERNPIERRATETALAFGALIRSRRKALGMRQVELALATGVGRRFLIELEAGKPSCQLGRSLLVAETLGLRPIDILSAVALPATPCAELPDLPDLIDEETDERPAGIL